jgi:hypothetical protein
VDKNITEQPASNVQDAIVKSIEEEQAAIACSLDDPDGCEMCSG